MSTEIIIETDEFNEVGLALIEATAEAAGSEEIVKLVQYTRRLQSQLAQVEQERDELQEHLNSEQALNIIAPRTLKKEVSDAIEELK